MTFRIDFKRLLRWRHLLAILIVNTLITFFLIIDRVDEITKGSAFFKYALYYFLLVQFIGFSIYFLNSFFYPEKIRQVWLRWLAITGLVCVAGWAGFILGQVVLSFLPWADFYLPHNLTQFLVNTSLFIVFGIITTLFFVIKERLNRTAARLAEKEVQEQRLSQLKTRAELDALRARVNPHFLFNTLNSIASLIPVDPQGAEEMVQKLSHLFRHSLESHHEPKIALRKEVAVIQKYLEIEKVRLGNRLQFSIDADESALHLLVPALLIQPVVENSIKHGIAPKPGGGEVRLHCFVQTHQLIIEVWDTGMGYHPTHGEGGFGLRSVRERLERYYPGRYEFAIENRNGTRVRLTLPVENEEMNVSNPAD